MTPPVKKKKVFAIIGAGNGGKTTALDLALQGARVRLFEFEPWAKEALTGVHEAGDSLIGKKGVFIGCASLEKVTDKLEEAIGGADVIVCCLQSASIETAARRLVDTGLLRKDHVVVLNPGSTGGSLVCLRVFAHEEEIPLFVEFSTLTYGTRAEGAIVNCSVLVKRVLMGCLPASRRDEAAFLTDYFPGLISAPNVLTAGLANANPVIHPSITILNSAVMENEGSTRYFYKDGVSPMVARLIKTIDEERLAILEAFGTPGMRDSENSKIQGYSDQDDPEDYYTAYAKGPGFAEFKNPDCTSLGDHRYYAEDVGRGLLLYCALGKACDLPTPASATTVAFASVITGRDYIKENKDPLEHLGLKGMDKVRMLDYVTHGL